MTIRFLRPTRILVFFFRAPWLVGEGVNIEFQGHQYGSTKVTLAPAPHETADEIAHKAIGIAKRQLKGRPLVLDWMEENG